MDEKYKVICPNCGKEFKVRKSMAHEMGLNEYGHGSCPGCDAFLNMTYDPEKNAISVRDFEEWRKEKNGAKV